VLGDTLFVHGGVDTSALAQQWGPTTGPATFQGWVDALNKWSRDEVARWAEMDWHANAKPELTQWALKNHGTYEERQPGSALLTYGMGGIGPNSTPNPTVVYRDWIGRDGAPSPPGAFLINKLKAAGIRRVVSGHKPHGDAPLILEIAGITIITADTSYSVDVKGSESPVMKAFDKVSGRGTKRAKCCCAEIHHANGVYTAHGVTADGTAVEAEMADGIVGRKTKDGWWAKSIRKRDNKVLISKSKGYTVENKYVSKEAFLAEVV